MQSSFNGDSPLHLLLKYKPPLHVIILLSRKLSEISRKSIPEAVCDQQGRTPLHVACAHGCSIAVIARLMNGATAKFGNPASVPDASNMLPLHWACGAAGNDVENMKQVIGLLVGAYAEGVLMSDCREGRLPTWPTNTRWIPDTPPRDSTTTRQRRGSIGSDLGTKRN
jgi:Ankyrin repeat